eukprot:CAMPEP_0118894898 /NCGR_PEP_ID=MMETSP1166-20130328/3486_1 /TAXON_ID=1104430 /ORGANISM="Chrysoreinhardia sp, Strain CCMP3193" /LENGTH=72 /DNA_ID=CAMNT_0006833865 /DNA_START=16 /DNA_END=231 /DNA_ORIENTATION=+
MTEDNVFGLPANYIASDDVPLIWYCCLWSDSFVLFTREALRTFVAGTSPTSPYSKRTAPASATSAPASSPKS